MPEKNDQENNTIRRAVDARFLIGLALLIFLVLINSFVAEIPWFIVAIPSLLMGLDLESLVRAWRGNGDNKEK